jgi:hypothetical protein
MECAKKRAGNCTAHGRWHFVPRTVRGCISANSQHCYAVNMTTTTTRKSAPSAIALTKPRKIALGVLFVNLLLIGFFPPYDYVAMHQANVPTFEGFRFVFSNTTGRLLNSSFLWLELAVLLINFLIAWLLLGPVTPSGLIKANRAQRLLLIAVALNLTILLLFPPFENFTAITKAVLPSFEGFYFVFSDNSKRQIVTPILFLEVAVVLINAALLWLFLRDRSARKR